MGARTETADPARAGDLLADVIIDLMKKTDMPNGLQAVGYTPEDVDWLVNGTLPQHRVTKLSPRPADASQLKQLFLDAMLYW
jgi:hydroxyacid-oxoacid transhydrogenase